MIPARSAIPPRWIPLAKELGVGRLEGRLWTADESEIEAIRSEAAVMASKAKAERKAKRARGRREIARSRAAHGARIESLQSEWRKLCEGEEEEARIRWIEDHRDELEGPLGREAFGIEPIANKPLYFAVVAALRGMRSGRSPAASIRVAALHYKVEVSRVAEIVGRVGGRRLSARKRGSTVGLRAGEDWRDVERSPEDLGL